jgi:hypothetical protein
MLCNSAETRSSPLEAISGHTCSIWLASSGTFLPPLSPATRNFSGRLEVTLSVLVPMDPVEPRIEITFIEVNLQSGYSSIQTNWNRGLTMIVPSLLYV